MTDLVARYWQGGTPTVVPHPAYSHIGLPIQDLVDQKLCLLHLANTTTIGAEDWRYFGKHALPLVLGTWVELANSSMKQYHAATEVLQILTITEYITTLCESYCTCKDTGLCLHAYHCVLLANELC